MVLVLYKYLLTFEVFEILFCSPNENIWFFYYYITCKTRKYVKSLPFKYLFVFFSLQRIIIIQNSFQFDEVFLKGDINIWCLWLWPLRYEQCDTCLSRKWRFLAVVRHLGFCYNFIEWIKYKRVRSPFFLFTSGPSKFFFYLLNSIPNWVWGVEGNWTRADNFLVDWRVHSSLQCGRWTEAYTADFH